ncbi:hypothetical protein J2W91_001234 [Paenibacillus amylolyticus]|uniref:Uncharacterized protein n=1 Tax=Paenibacillus amylolyticus TaxID=1451 RepID=A0AAP5LKY6_PAEAM|nr:hypothetical protein [Paenibacillus amylolyticus]MDR6722782.1 hypothetical protein [Paenibacillus amylolyticus]
MRQKNVVKYILIMIAAVLVSNVIQFYVFNQDNTAQKDDTLQPIYESKSNIYADYSARVQNINRFLVNLNNARTRNETKFFSDGFISGMSADHYTYLESIILKMDHGEYTDEVQRIIETNQHLYLMVYELRDYFDVEQDDADFPDHWNEVHTLLEEITNQIASGSSESTTLYNITSYPENFIIKTDYETTMTSLNENIAKVIELIR